jgi:hypothetical protein
MLNELIVVSALGDWTPLSVSRIIFQTSFFQFYYFTLPNIISFFFSVFTILKTIKKKKKKNHTPVLALFLNCIYNYKKSTC